jgi:hypothetical protein
MSEHRVVAAISDQRGAVELMQSLARRGSCLVQLERRRWVVLARCSDSRDEKRLLRQVTSWAETHPAVEIDVEPGTISGWTSPRSSSSSS